MAQTILIIDSDQVQRDLLTHSLQNRLGYRITTTPSIREAALLFQGNGSSSRPDLILFDWSGAGPQETCAGLKQISTYAPLVVLVRYGDYDAATLALSSGAQDFLMKPVAMERMGTTFRNLLLLRDARREIDRMRRDRQPEFAGQTAPAPYYAPASAAPVSLVSEDGNIRRMVDIEAEAIRFAMQYYHGRMTEVARRLGIGRSTLYRKLGELSARHEVAA